jgi:hypothetical protein
MKTKFIFTLILIVIGFILALYPTIYWFLHDSLTRMQLFKKFWWLELIAVCLLISARYLLEKIKYK